MFSKALNFKITNRHYIIMSYILSVMISAFVFFTGGTTMVYANLMYIPIALISSTNGKKVGVLHAIFSALLVGPYMPLDTSLNLSQAPINWIIRMIIYTTIAFIIGFLPITTKEIRNTLQTC